MSLARSLFAGAAMLAMLGAPIRARAQMLGGLPGPANQMMPLSALEQAGPDTVRKHGKDAATAIRDAKRKYNDADPRVRVQGLESLRYIDSPEVNSILFRGLSDPDVRVRIKAIDVLGARGTTDAVPQMTQDLYLRDTPAIEKLHLVAALGRIGDARGALPIIDFLNNTDEKDSRGTAVFALGEIGNPAANDVLTKTVSDDPSPMVRKLAREALEKIDGELPNRRSEEEQLAKEKQLVPTDQKLSKLRQMDQAMHAHDY